MIVLPAASLYSLAFKGLAWFLAPLALVFAYNILLQITKKLTGVGFILYITTLISLLIISQVVCSFI